MAEHVSLREITAGNRTAVSRLRVAPEQEGFVDGVPESLREAADNPRLAPWPRAVYADGVPVGFVLLADGVPAGEELPWPFYLWRMLIDHRYQRRGYGRAALDAVVAYLRTRPAAELVTSVVPGPGSPHGFYLRYGFVDTGELFDHERVLRLPL